MDKSSTIGYDDIRSFFDNADTGALQRLASRRRFIACIQAYDYCVLTGLALLLFSIITHDGRLAWNLPNIIISLLVSTSMICIFHCFQLYNFALLTRAGTSAMRAFIAGCMLFAPLLAPLLMREDLSGQSMTAFAVVASGLVGVMLSRLCFARLATVLRQTGVVGRRIYVVADCAASAADLQARLRRLPDNKIVGCCILSDRAGPVEQQMDAALSLLRTYPVDVVALSLPLSEPERVVDAARVLRRLPQKVMLSLNLEGTSGTSVWPKTTGSDELGTLGMIKLSDRPLSGWLWVAKDVQERLLALLILMLISPVMLMISAAIKFADPGPVLFRQKRLGYGNEPFEILKFRTMREFSDRADPTALQLTTRDDPRVFPLGRVLRKTSLDELPQLLNVLKGDMWIVGPRPHSPYAQAAGVVYAKAVQEYAARYRLKPGITGWAQVCGWRGPTDTLEQLSSRVDHDLYYIENWSMLFDIKILWRTLQCVFRNENAF